MANVALEMRSYIGYRQKFQFYRLYVTRIFGGNIQYIKVTQLIIKDRQKN